MKKLFVYGTLRDGHPNSARFGLSGNCDVTRNVRLNGFQIFDVSWFPGIQQGEGHVIGDVFTVPDELWPALDAYEGVPSLYRRESVTIGAIEGVQVYVYNGSVKADSVIADGDWLAFNEERQRIAVNR